MKKEVRLGFNWQDNSILGFLKLRGVKLLMILIMLANVGMFGQTTSISSLPYTKTDNFNTFNPTSAATATSTITTGWSYSGPTNYRGRGTGTGNSGGFYALGSGSDYSLGALRSGTSDVYTYSISFTNNSGSTITSITLKWNYEQWRFVNTSGWNVTGTGQLSSNATLNAADFAGTATGNHGTVSSTPINLTLDGLNITPGQSFGLRFDTTDATGSDNAVSIDDFSITASAAAVPPTISVTPTSLTGLGYVQGGTSTPQNITITGSNLTPYQNNEYVDVIFQSYNNSTTENFEFSLDGGAYTNWEWIYLSGNTASGTVGARLKAGLPPGTYTDKIIVGYTDQNDPFYIEKEITLSGTVTAPVATVPIITTTTLTGTYPAASSGGNITSQGASAVSQRGVIWGTSAAAIAALPTLGAANTVGMSSNGTGTGSFTALLAGLQPGTTVYYRAYATNGTGTGYGAILSYSVSGYGTSLAYWNFGATSGSYTETAAATLLPTATLTASGADKDTDGKDGFVYNGAVRGQALTWNDAKASSTTATYTITLNTTSYQSLHFRADYLAEQGGSYTLSYSTDGSTWTNITTTAALATRTTADFNWQTIYHSLPAALDNLTNVRLRFTANDVSGGINDELRFDNIELWGQCITPATPANSFAASENPSCGPVTLSYNGTAPNGVAYYWQTTATANSTASPVSTPQTIASTAYRWVRARSSCGIWSASSVQSPQIVINALPTITTHPANQSVIVGATATFSVAITTTTTATYQWQENTGSTWTDISGATAATYVTPATTIAMSGNQYQVKVTNSCGTVTSNAAALTVAQPTITLTSNPSLFSYAEGQGPSTHQTFTVSGTNLASDIVLTAPTNWEISTTATFNTPLSTITLVKNASNNVSTTNIHIRLKAGLLLGTYSGIFDASATNVATQTTLVNGEVSGAVAFINVEANLGTFPDITNGTNTPIGTQNTLFGAQLVGNSDTKSYRIQNLGGAVLNLSGLTLTGANPGDFTISSPPPATIAPGATVTFEVTFSPTALGIRNAIVNIPNNSANISSFTFNIRGTGNNAEIDITGNGVAIANGTTTISTANNTFIGTANANAANPSTAVQSFTISNSGNITLAVTGITISDAANFTVSPTTATITAGNSTTFTVTFNPVTAGVKNATISIANNDLTDNENPYTFAVQGNASSFIACTPSEEETAYETGFDSTEGYSSNNTYNNTSIVFLGPVNKQWGTIHGTVSNQSAISNGLSMQMRLYSSNVKGYVFTNFGTDNVSKVTFKAKSPDGLKIAVSYSENGGAYGNSQEYSLTGANPTTPFEYVVSTTGENENIRIRFDLVGTAPSSGNKALIMDEVKILSFKDNTKTWNGTAWSGDGTPPTASQKAIFTGDYNTAVNGSVTACECEIGTNVTLTVAPMAAPSHQERYVSIESNILNNGIIEILNNNTLYQANDAASTTGLGIMRMERITQPMYRYDFTYWSSPLTLDSGFKLGTDPTSLSPGTLFDKFYKWKHDGTPNQAWEILYGGEEVMVPGRGYIVRAPQSFPVSPTEVLPYTATFVGVPNNGIVEHAVTGGTEKWNLIGNPYPSAINIEQFLIHNRSLLEGTIYLWTHNSPVDQNQYTANDYATYNFTGPVSTKPSDSSGANTNTPSQFLASGQAFFVKGLASGTVLFDNAMRRKDNNNWFFKPSPTTPVDNWDMTGKHRIWLNLSNTQGAFNQTLVGYIENATNALDWGYDGERFSGNHVALYSILDGTELSVQGRGLPFNNQDLVPLGYNSTLTGTLSIGLDHVDGIFEGQDIFLEDLLLNVTHDLKAGDYSFATVAGTFNSRFVLKYTNTTLGTDNPDTAANGLLLYNSNGTLNIKSTTEALKGITVYDLLGRVIFEDSTLDSNTFSVSHLALNEQVLIVKVTLENGVVVSKKIIY